MAKRRFTLRRLMFLVTAVAVVFGFVGKELADRRAAERAYQSALVRLRAGGNLVKELGFEKGPVVLALDGNQPLSIEAARDVNAATRIVAEFGWDTARIILGHHTLSATRIYAENDVKRAAEAMAKLG